MTYGIIAQLGEHLPYKQRVIGSSPIGPILQQEIVADFKIVQLQNVTRCWNAAVAELADAQDLKSCGTDTPVPVRFRSAALVKNGRNVEFTAFLLFFCFKMFEHL